MLTWRLYYPQWRYFKELDRSGRIKVKALTGSLNKWAQVRATKSPDFGEEKTGLHWTEPGLVLSRGVYENAFKLNKPTSD